MIVRHQVPLRFHPDYSCRMNLTEFKRNPGRHLKNAQAQPLILYSHTTPLAYVINQKLYRELVREFDRANNLASTFARLIDALDINLLALRERRPDLTLLIDSALIAYTQAPVGITGRTTAAERMKKRYPLDEDNPWRRKR